MAAAAVFPVSGVALRVRFSIVDGDGAIVTGWTGAAATVSKDGAAFAATTAAPVEIGATGVGYIDLTAGEMTAKSVTLKVTVTNVGAVARVLDIITGGLTEIAAAVAAAILETPANLLLTNADGQVECSNLAAAAVSAIFDAADYGDTAGRATNIGGQIAQIWRYLVNANTINRSTGAHVVFKDDETTAMLEGVTTTNDVTTTVGMKD